MSTQLEFIQSVPTPADEIISRADALNAACWHLDSQQASDMVFGTGLYAPWVDVCPGLVTNISLWGVYTDAVDYLVAEWVQVLKAPEYQDICTKLLELYP